MTHSLRLGESGKPPDNCKPLNETIIARRCACKGWATGPEEVNEATADRLAVSMARHQESEPHKSFDWAEWRERNTAKVDVPVTVRRVA